MKLIKTILIVMIICFNPLYNSQSSGDNYAKINMLIEKGDFADAEKLINNILADKSVSEKDRYDLQLKKEIMDRIRLDFKRDESEILAQLKKYYPDITSKDLAKWEQNKKLEFMIIDGNKKYFNRSVPNLFRKDGEARKIKEMVDGKSQRNLDDFLKMHIPSVVNEADKTKNRIVKPIRKQIKYKLSVDKNEVPTGEIVRCWLPVPKENERQYGFNLLNVNSDTYILADKNADHRTLYMEKIVEDNKETLFEIEYEYISNSYFNFIDYNRKYTIDRNSEIYRNFTREEAPHILFTDEIKELSSKIIGDEINPIQKALKIFTWICKNIPWASAREYSTIPNISMYCLKNMHGDCGIKTLLFITLCRYNGIPAKWQSGWMTHPVEINLHDWSEIYFDELGWIPVDQSFGIQNFEDERMKYFYLGNIDSYRLIVNDEISKEFYPLKIYPRSETVDFQRGEVEWKGGNLYFNRWDYNMKIDFLEDFNEK